MANDELMTEAELMAVEIAAIDLEFATGIERSHFRDLIIASIYAPRRT